MITICPACGNHEWNKEVREGRIFCPVCGGMWELPRVPLLILTGCSGVGKTTTARLLTEVLGAAGHCVHVISIDDFYYDKAYLQKRADLDPDIEIDYD